MFKLMIVDDELLMRVGIRSMVDWETHGFTIAGEASNGEEALELALEVEPDLIMTDIKMPKMDGLQLIRAASKQLRACKYVILSYFNEFQFAQEALRLGAIDYLIKNEITSSGLIQLLKVVHRKLMEDKVYISNNDHVPHATESLSHLKENLFKDIISGLLDDEEAVSKAEQLRVRLRSDSLQVVKLRIDNFKTVRKKYVEKDERLLRFSVMNMLEEMIPNKWNREVVIESSSDYLLIINTLQDEGRCGREKIVKLCETIQQAMKDFMNLSLSIGISTVVQNLKCLRNAYREAELALQSRFFAGAGHIFVYKQSERKDRSQTAGAMLHDHWEEMLRKALHSHKEEKFIDLLHDIRRQLTAQNAGERQIRETYIWLTEIISTELSYLCGLRLPEEDKLPYEAVLSAETWDEIHSILIHYVRRCFTRSHQMPVKSYADLAADFIKRYYAEEITLMSVANQINVNPSYLSRLFKQEKGENFVSYLTRVRMERAKSFLESGKYKVSEVADRVGYHNYPYFSKIFKKIVGMSPEEYRGS